MPEPWNRDWIEAELRALRELIIAEQKHVSDRFHSVNELRQQVLEERGVFVRHEALNAISDRLARVEQTFIGRPEHDMLANRLFSVEKSGITRVEWDDHNKRLGKLESFGPLIVIIVGAIASVTGGIIVYFVTRGWHA
jgi:hypothetical protein